MSLNHPLVGIEWIITFILMVIIIVLRERGYRPVALYGLILGGFVSWSFGYFGEYPLNFDVEFIHVHVVATYCTSEWFTFQLE